MRAVVKPLYVILLYQLKNGEFIHHLFIFSLFLRFGTNGVFSGCYRRWKYAERISDDYFYVSDYYFVLGRADCPSFSPICGKLPLFKVHRRVWLRKRNRWREEQRIIFHSKIAGQICVYQPWHWYILQVDVQIETMVGPGESVHGC